MNLTQLTNEQCLTIWTHCFDPDLREEVPLEHVPDYIRLYLGPRVQGNIAGLETFVLKLWEQGEGALGNRLQALAREQRELN